MTNLQHRPNCSEEVGLTLEKMMTREPEKKFSSIEPGYEFDVALIHLGTNDLLLGMSDDRPLREIVDDTVDHLNTLVAMLRAKNPAAIIYMAKLMPNLKSKAHLQATRALNVAISCLIADLNSSDSPVVLVNQFDGFESSLLATDKLHPTISGARFMAQKWYEKLAPMMARLTTGNRFPLAIPFFMYRQEDWFDSFYTTEFGVLGCRPDYPDDPWRIVGTLGYIYRQPFPGTVRLSRYLNPIVHDHFYTIQAKGAVIGNWELEGSAGYVYPSEVPGSVPVYRFWNQSLGDHRYSAARNDSGTDEAEGWRYEGIAFYVRLAP